MTKSSLKVESRNRGQWAVEDERRVARSLLRLILLSQNFLHPPVFVRQTHANLVVADVSPYLDKTVLRKVLVPRHVHFDQNLDGFEALSRSSWGCS